MRGALESPGRHENPVGIIPADAGSTVAPARRSGWYTDHPRGCGEHLIIAFQDGSLLGSSPRMRGAPATKNKELYLIRIIPADAGSTSFILRPSMKTKDHPRGCGEHQAQSGS